MTKATPRCPQTKQTAATRAVFLQQTSGVMRQEHCMYHLRCPQTKPWPLALFPKLTSDAMRQEHCMYDQRYPMFPTDKNHGLSLSVFLQLNF